MIIDFRLCQGNIDGDFISSFAWTCDCRFRVGDHFEMRILFWSCFYWVAGVVEVPHWRVLHFGRKNSPFEAYFSNKGSKGYYKYLRPYAMMDWNNTNRQDPLLEKYPRMHHLTKDLNLECICMAISYEESFFGPFIYHWYFFDISFNAFQIIIT